MMTQAARSYRWLFFTLALVGFAIDQGGKYFVFHLLYNDGRGGDIVVVPQTFSLIARYTDKLDTGEHPLSFLRTIGGEYLPQVNHGALFGIGNAQNGNLLFMLISAAASLAILMWMTRETTARDGYLCFSLGFILAGTLGNLYDRVVFEGVRDFLYWYKFVDWPVFNFADCFLVVGAGLLFVQALLASPIKEEAPISSSAEMVRSHVS